MAVSKAQQKAVHKYVKANYDRMELIVPKGRKNTIKAAAAAVGESVNAYINTAITLRMNHSSDVSPSARPQEAQEMPQVAGTVSLPIETLKSTQERAERVSETILAKSRSRYKGGGTKEYIDLRKSIDEIAADMYNAENDVVYGVDELVGDIKVNADVYIQQLRRMLEIHSTLLTDENKPIVHNEIESHILNGIRNVMEELL